MSNNNDFDLDQFWRELINKSKWATKNTGSLSGSYKKLNILKEKKEEVVDSLGSQQLENIKNKLLTYYLIIILFAVFIFTFSVLLIFISSGCKSNIKFIKDRCFKAVDHCNSSYAINSIWTNGACSCPEGFIEKDKICISNVSSCLAYSSVFVASDGTCKCSSGYVMNGQKCISNFDYCRLRDAIYLNEFTFDTEKPLCACGLGKYWDKVSESCMKCEQLLVNGGYNGDCRIATSTKVTTTNDLIK